MLGLGVKNRDLSVYYVWIQIGKSYLGLRDKFAKTRLPHGAIWSQPDCPQNFRPNCPKMTELPRFIKTANKLTKWTAKVNLIMKLGRKISYCEMVTHNLNNYNK